jgi:hypothetical protein
LENREPLKPKIKRKNGAGKEHRTPTTLEHTTTSFADITTGQKPSPAPGRAPHHHHTNPTAPPPHQPDRTTTTPKTHHHHHQNVTVTTQQQKTTG